MRANIICFVLGGWLLQQQAELPDTAWAWALLPLIVPAFLLSKRARLFLRIPGEALLKAVLVGAGFFWAAFIAQSRLADGLPPQWEGRDIALTGVVASLPQTTDRGARFEFDVERVSTEHAGVPPHISLTWYQGRGEEGEAAIPRIHAGERWRLTVRLRRPHGAANPHGFDFEAWALERNIRAIGYVRMDANNGRLREMVGEPSYRIARLRQDIRDRFEAVLQDRPFAGVLVALAIGDQNAIPRNQWQVFTRTGVNHLMSISGLHVTMVSSLLFALTYWLWRRSHRLTLWLPARKAAVLAGACAALAYALLAGFAVPAQRTVYMLAVVALALWLGRMSSPSSVLALALLVVALADPWAVLSPGFWLSFGAVAVIMLVSVGRIGRPHWVVEWAQVQWAVTLGLIPPLLAMFQQVSIISPLANAFAIPVVSLVVVPLTLLAAVPWLDVLLLPAHEVMSWCMVLLTWMSGFPAAVWQQHAPPAWTIAVAMIGIIWVLLPKGFPGRWVGVFGLAPMFLALPPVPPAGALWLTVLDVGQGLAVVARTHSHALLYDAGPEYGAESDSGSRIIVPFLRGEGITHLDGMIITHHDSDHSGGALSVLDAVPVGWFASSLSDEDPILEHATNGIPCHAGQSWQWDGVRFDMLHPGLAAYENPNLKTNDLSCVLKITVGANSVLLPGDIEKRSERELLERSAGLLPSSVLIAPHHGSRTSSTQEFIRAVNPRLTIFTVGYRNRFGHPKEEIVQRYRIQGSRLLRSDEEGAVTLRFEGQGASSVESDRRMRQRYWQDAVTRGSAIE